MAKPLPEVVDLNTRIFVAGLKIGDVLERARVGRAAWSKWRQGVAPNLARVHAVSEAIDSLIAEKELQSGSQSRFEEEGPAPGGGE